MHLTLRTFTFFAASLGILASLHADIVITEFVASNQNGLLDEDNATSDWIELYNDGAAAVNLNGWRLTDDSADLSKWVFPSVSIDPQGFLVVFASQKNRINPASPLHTNFKLSSAGGYLALLRANGTKSTEFNPYPAQYDDKPYGFGQTVTTTQLVGPSASAKVLIPTSATPNDATWSARTFNDSAWTTATSGIGFESTVSGFAFRTYFANTSVPNVATANSVVATPSMQSQTYAETRAVVNFLDSGGDGHYSPNSNPSWANGGADNYVVVAEGTITVPTAGTWTFGVNSDDGFTLNIGPNSSSTTLVCQFDGGRAAADTIGTYTFPSAGEYYIRVMIYETAGGSAGELFARLGSVGAWDGTFRLVGDTAGGGLAVKSAPIGSSSSGYSGQFGAGGNIGPAMANISSSAYIRQSFSIANPATLTTLTMPVKYDDGFVAYLNGTEVARRNAPAGTAVNTTTASGDRLPAQALVYENIDLTGSLGLLVPSSTGANVLAIHGLNQAATNGDFLIRAELNQYSVSTTVSAQFYTTGTPGGFNTSPIYNKVAPVVVNIGRGIYSAAQTVTLSCATPGASIYYTYDGSSPFRLTTSGALVRDGNGNALPSATAGLYSAPLTISSTKVIRYAGLKAGSDPSDSVTQTYLFMGDVITQSASAAGGSGPAPVIANPPGASPANSAWPTSVSSGQILDYGMDPNVVNNAAYSGTIINDLKSLPSVSVVTDLPFLFDNATGIYSNPGGDTVTFERPASVELINTAGASEFQINCGLRIRGGYSRSTGNPKHGFRLFFRDTYGPAKLKYNIFGNDPTAVNEFSKFDLRTMQNYSWAFGGDGSGIFIRDVFSRQTQLDMGQPSSHSTWYHLYLNGQYWGIYNVDERPEANFAESYLGGNADDYDTIKVAPDNGYTIYATDGNDVAWNSLWTQADSGLSAGNSEILNNTAYQKLLGNNPNGTPNPAFATLVDPVNLIDYNMIIYWGGNLDAAISNFLGNTSPNNWFGFRDRTGAHGGFRFVVHDSEHTILDVNQDRTGPWPAGSSSGGGGYPKSNPQYIFQQLINSLQFKTLFADRVYKHFANGGALSPSVALARYDALKAQIDRSVVGESARWGDSKTEPALTHDGTWLPAINDKRNNYVPNRGAIVLQQFKTRGWYPTIDPPVWSQRGGTVNSGSTITLSVVAGQSGTIYYTVDGSDPRTYNVSTGTGDISTSATAYSGPITINSSKIIRARVRNGTTWSAIDEATFYTPQNFSTLAMTEIHYNPLPNGAVLGEDLEFVELKNTGATELDLGGLTFTSGIVFTFPPGTKLLPGAFFVLSRDATAGQTNFHARYPGVTVGGVYTGKLDNAGETITLSTAAAGIVFSFTYNDVAPWPAAADGSGYSLVPKASVYQSSSGLDWRASAAVHGSPGADDPPVNFPLIVVNEALTNSASGLFDSIELYNASASAVDISDWWLSDATDTPQKYRIPTGTIIPAGGYVTFTEAQFNPTPGVGNSFALNSAGDEVYLFSGNASGSLTGYSHGFSFDGAELNVSFGRYVNSFGVESFPRQISRTFGAANSGPLVGPLVINEVMYNPYAGFDEYIEIRNISGATVNLFEATTPANTWRIGGIGYSFPTGQSIPAGAYALVVGIDPAAFRTKYSVPPAVQIFGPYVGTLQDDGERLSLEMPDAPIAVAGGGTVVPYIVIDSVRYDDVAPWSNLADGAGPSLQRTDSTAFGDDAANWFANGATGGYLNAVNQLPTVALTAPASGSTFTVPATITFTATATDSDGTIIKVEYYDGTNKIGESATGPNYSFAWTATGGVHNITAKTLDNGLGVATSQPITVYVTQPVAQGLRAEFYNDRNLTSLVGTRLDNFVFFSETTASWPTAYGFPGLSVADNFSVRWSGQLRPTLTGNYTLETVTDEGVRLYLNGNLVINNWTSHTAASNTYVVALTANTFYDITIEYYEGTGANATSQLWYTPPGSARAVIPQARLYPDSVPIIVTQPAALTREQGTSATFSVVSSGKNLVYQWRKGGISIPGATASSYTIPFCLTADAGAYSVIVGNNYGFAISSSVNLTVTFTDTDGDGMQNSWETANGFNPNLASDASLDTDGDGMTNLQEFLAGTDPRNSASRFTATVVKAASGPGFTVAFAALPYKTYRIQARESLSTGDWADIQSYSASPAQQTINYTDPTAQPVRFYRVATP